VAWNYSNSSASNTTVNLSLTGLSPGKVVSVVFSNGSAVTRTIPNVGVSPEPLQAAAVVAKPNAALELTGSHADEHGHAAHAQLMHNNRMVAKKLVPISDQVFAAGAASRELAIQPRALYAPALNTTKSWIDYGGPGTAPVNYTTTAQAVCTAPSGRNVVVWVDPAAMSLGKATPTSIAAFANTYCGVNGASAQITALMGDAWGANAARYPTQLIQDTVKQDINIIVLNVPSSVTWAGYFWGGNNLLKSLEPNSNQALAFFINADQLSRDLKFTLSTLLHETAHMVNFYQRTISKGYDHDTWLEETSAMMTEDIVAPSIIKNADGSDYNKIASLRLPGYLTTGGAVSYINWVGSSENYYMGGAFGAFLNRRYGLNLYKQLVTSCADGTATTTSYGCLDGLVKANGGISFADDFARLGASIFGTLPAVGAPAGYGFPAVSSLGYSLVPIDVSAMVSLLPASPKPITSGFSATTHSYLRITLAVGASTYSRRNIVVPANTTISVVVK
jgi:Peptidase M30